MSKLGKKKGHTGHFRICLNELNDKTRNSILLLKLKRGENVRQGRKTGQWLLEWSFRERRLDFSLKSWEIRPSAIFGTRRETALRGEGFAWVPDLGSFLKLREVGVSPYLGFILRLSVFTMFALNEAVRGRLFCSKAWNRGVGF